MAKKDKIAEKIKEGVSVEEIEKFARKYTTEVFLIIAIIIATISSAFGFFTGPTWSLLFGGLGAVISVAMPDKLEGMLKKITTLAFKKDKSTEIIVGIVRIVLSIFIPFIIFAEIGLLSGITFHHFARTHDRKKTEKKPESLKEEEHI